MRILDLLQEAGGALATAGLLAGLFDQVNPGARSSLSRSIKALRNRGLVLKYKGVRVGGHAARIVALTGAGVEVAQEIAEEEGQEPEP
jgi:DNA-binding PadR family transcriptional regulator